MIGMIGVTDTDVINKNKTELSDYYVQRKYCFNHLIFNQNIILF